jgi:aspartate carbamoyltransferase catalytic subunit
MPNIISTKQFKKSEVEKLLALSALMEKACLLESKKGGKKNKIKACLEDKIIACIFFEPSTRTRLSFETAALKLGAKVISAENAGISSSAYKGETIEDTTRMLCSYADAVVMRHPRAGTAEAAAKVATKPIINAGDGANQHPSQGLLDLYTIKKKHKRLDNLTITFVGDLLNSRTLHSLVPLLNMYKNNKFNFISPKELKLDSAFTNDLKNKKIKFVESENLDEVLGSTDALYMTRVQKERFARAKDYEKVKDSFILKVQHLKKMKKDAIIMHPLPRVNEIEIGVDADPRAAYFRQAENGLWVRMALLCYALGI